MALIRCTKKLLTELPSPVEEPTSKPTILGDWHANLLRIERRKCVLFTNDETLFSVFIPMLTKPHFQNLASVFLDNLMKTLKSEGFNERVEQVKKDYTGNLAYDKTNNRSVLGTMNDITRCLLFLLERREGLEKADPIEINHEINRISLVKKPFFNAQRGLQRKLFAHSITFKIITHGSHEYKKCISLREDILRKPLGLAFTCEELEKEKAHVHIGGFVEDELCATAMLVPEGQRLKMQRVAVKEDHQGKGIASAMMKFCENYALEKGFKEIYCHARETAVPFYKKNKYVPEGEPFMEATIPHLKMRKVIKSLKMGLLRTRLFEDLVS
jgi:predicted GNAT family N-acyltransferase